MFVYLLQVFVLQLIFFGFYQLFFRKETFFRLNRLYLLGSVLFSAVLPLLHFSLGKTQAVIYGQLEPVIIGTKQFQGNIEKISLPDNFIPIYIVGMLVGLFYLGLKLFKLWRLYRLGDKYYKEHYIIVQLQDFHNVFSFWKIIFIGNHFSNDEQQKILAHERVHIRCKHSFDLMLMEIFKIIFWWNPLNYWYQKELELQHEFAADKKSLEKFASDEYYGLILKQTFRVESNFSFVNQFYKKSLIKKRIIMQKRRKSQKTALIKYVSFLILAMGMGIFLNACNNKITEVKKTNQKSIDEKQNKNSDETIKEDEDTEVAFQFINNPPVYPGCEGLEGKEAKSCTQKKIQKFVAENFNKSIASELGIKDKNVRILTQFTIDKNGKISNIKTRSKYKKLAEEAKRVIATLPQMKPGMYEGKIIKVVYTLPIIFKIDEEEEKK